MAGWIKTAIRMEVGLSQAICVRWGPSPPPQKGSRAPSSIFVRFLLWSSGWMHQDATWYGGRLGPGDFVLDETQPPPQKGAVRR